MIFAKGFEIVTKGRGASEITRRIDEIVRESAMEQALCNVFLHHTSASLILCENADPTVLRDLEAFFSRLVPDGDRLFRHQDEGPDDMPAHVRSILTANSVSIPVANHRCDLGTWQGVFLYEHRAAPHRRRITVTVVG